MSTRKSKKGFQKLDNHELSEFTALGNGTLESGSENELLDLTTVEEGEPRGRLSGCCFWCSCLYFGVLTILFLLIGVYCGYLTFNIWQMTDSTTNTHNDLDSRLSRIEAGIKSFRSDLDSRHSALKHSIDALEKALNGTQQSLKGFQKSTQVSLTQVGSKVDNLDKRLKVAESKPQEMLIKQVDIINKDMGVLNTNMRKLNTSLSDINTIKSQLAELGTVNSRYDDELLLIKNGIAEVRQDNSDMKESVDAAVDAAAKFKTRLDSVDSSLSSTHDQMQQTTDLLSAQVTSVKESLDSLNETVRPCLDNLWSNLTTMNSSVEMLSIDLHALSDQVVQILNHSPDSLIKTDYTPTAPPPTLRPLTEKNDEDTFVEVEKVTAKPSERTTPPTPPTDLQSTSATEDRVPVDASDKPKATVAANGNEQPLNVTEEEIEASKLLLEKQINQTQAAITLLQSLADDFLNLDNNDDDELDLEEFLIKIPKPYIFDLLDTDQDESLGYSELLQSIDHLRLKLNQLRRELKALVSFEEEVEEELEGTTEPPVDESSYDPVLQQKLKDLFEYMMDPHDH